MLQFSAVALSALSPYHLQESLQNKSTAVADGRPFGHNRHGPKSGATVPLSVRGAGSPSNTVSPEPRPTSVRSGVLICSTVWPQYTNVSYRRDGQDNSLVAQGEPFYKRSPKRK